MPPSAEFTEVGLAAMVAKDLANGKNIAETAIDFISNKLKFGKVVKNEWANDFGLLREISNKKGNFGMGSANISKADEL